VEKIVSMQELRFFSAAAKGMVQYSTYGGSLAENVTQAVARDVMAAALVRLEEGLVTSCYTPVLHVHDSILCEVDEGAGSPEEFAELITLPLPWSAGLPLAAEAYRSKRFHG
jgi:DNA polymerase